MESKHIKKIIPTVIFVFAISLGNAALAQGTANPTGLSSLPLATSVHDTDAFPICQNGSPSCSLSSYVWSDVNIGQIASYLATRTTTLTNKTISCSNNTCTNIPTSALSGFLSAANFPAFTGDITTSAGSLVTTLSTVNLSPGSTTCSNITTNGKGLVTSNANGTCGGTTAPGGTSGQVQYNNANAFGGFTLGGDATLNTSTGALTLNTVNGSPGSTICSSVTTNAKGLVTSNSSGSCTGGSSAVPMASGTSGTLTGPNEYFVCTAACTVTPPAPSAGYQFCVLNGDSVATAITLAAIGSSARYENASRTGYGTAGTGTLVSSGAAGDQVCIVGLDATHYLTLSYNGTWTAS